jgi:hypothetical protein
MTRPDAANRAFSPYSPSTTATAPNEPGEFLTRRQSADYVREQLGRPLSFSTANKLAALGEFAPPALFWGRRPLYRRDDLRAWADARSRPGKQLLSKYQTPSA